MYGTEKERAHRAAVWRDNLAYIEAYNAQETTHWVRPPPSVSSLPRAYANAPTSWLAPPCAIQGLADSYGGARGFSVLVDTASSTLVDAWQASPCCGWRWRNRLITTSESLAVDSRVAPGASHTVNLTMLLSTRQSPVKCARDSVWFTHLACCPGQPELSGRFRIWSANHVLLRASGKSLQCQICAAAGAAQPGAVCGLDP